MGSLAGLLKAAGHDVRGSDEHVYPPMSTQLAEQQISVFEGFGPANLDWGPEAVVVGNVCRKDHVEVLAAQERNIPLESFPSLFGKLFLDSSKRSLVVAGTHGKTTTSSLLAQVLHDAGRDPSFLIGGVPLNFRQSWRLGAGGEFVVEGDEYDTAFFDKGPKFLHYFPDAAILTHVEFDHADIYADLEAVKTAFKRMVNLIPRRGRLVAFDASENVTECAARAFCKVERYGFLGDSYWRAIDLRQEGASTSWKLLRGGEEFARLRLPMAGEHNALNATAAAALAAGQGVSVEAIEAAIATFRSVKRRLEVRAEIAGVTVIDDFAHHPTAIRETLRALRAAYSGRRLWAVLEPRSNTLRRNVFERELVDSLALADDVVLAGVFKSDAIPVLERLEPSHVVEALVARGVPAVLCADADAIVSEIVPRLRFGDVIAILSNGGFGGIYEKLPKAIESDSHLERRHDG
jgi:UDP-N-acetylmuramate: L-alanyl-gamma-D-glutamyl-meso-diaminopimelate ligase